MVKAADVSGDREMSEEEQKLYAEASFNWVEQPGHWAVFVKCEGLLRVIGTFPSRGIAEEYARWVDQQAKESGEAVFTVEAVALMKVEHRDGR